MIYVIGLEYLLKELTEKKEINFLTAYLSSYPDCSQIFNLMELSTKRHNQDNVSMHVIIIIFCGLTHCNIDVVHKFCGVKFC